MSTAMEQPTLVERPAVKINGTSIGADLEINLIDTRVELVTNGVSQATLRFYDADFKLADLIAIGDEIEISFPKPGTKTHAMVFKGLVLELAMDQGPNDLHELVVTAFDKGYLLTRSNTPVAYQRMNFQQIVTKLAQQAGLKVKVAGFDKPVFPHILQTTDALALLNDISARAGVTWRVVGDELIVDSGVAPWGGSTPRPQVTVQWGRELRRFSTRINGAGATNSVQVRGWDIKTKRAIASTATQDFTVLSEADTSAQSRNVAYNTGGVAKRLVSNRVVDSQAEADVIAKAVRGRTDSSLTQARGEVFGDPSVVPGGTLVVEGMGAKFSGKYVLTSVEHVYTANGYVTRFQAGSGSASTLADVLGGGTRAYYGATVGVVTANNDDELKVGRVKVKLPMMGDDIETDWARVIAFGGGPQRGLQITPAVNDEVVVVFEGGDLRRPIVLGGVWNGKDAPPMATTATTKGGATKVWHLQTAAGYKLTFDENGGATGGVNIELKDGKTKLFLGDSKVELWANAGNPIEIKTGQSSIVMNSSNIDLTAQNINLKAQIAVKIEGSTFAAKGTASAQVEGATVAIKGQGAVNVEASGATMIKGAVVKIN